MIKILPTFRGYTVDVRLRQFRKVSNRQIEFIDFDSDEGDKLLGEFIETINVDTPEGKQLLIDIWS